MLLGFLRFTNIGNTTAFRNKGRSEIIDLTMTNSKNNLMDGWRVCSEYSFSDQSRSVFKLKSTGNGVNANGFIHNKPAQQLIRTKGKTQYGVEKCC